MIKEYKELTLKEKIITYNNYQDLCNKYEEFIPFENFEEYDEEQMFLNMDFDSKTLECLG